MEQPKGSNFKSHGLQSALSLLAPPASLGEATRLFASLASEKAEKERATYAVGFYERLVEWISGFDATLDQDHEVGVRLVNFGQALVFHLDSLGYSNPFLIIFRGTTQDGEPVELIQHVSQISILLMKVKRKDPTKVKRPIGFQSTTVTTVEADEQAG